MRQHHWLLLLLFFSGCATLGIIEYDKNYGITNIENRFTTPTISSKQSRHFNQKIKPIIENRCVVCHGCYDAPCQLKLESRSGLERGASKERVYNGERLLTAKANQSLSTLSKLNQDTLSHFRENGFFSVLNERQQTSVANTSAGLMYQMLQLKQQHPLPDKPLLDNRFEIALDRKQQCPTIEEFEKYKANFPYAGMPYALPNLTNEHYTLLTNWLKNGALLPQAHQATQAELNIIEQWETWLNGHSKKQQLVSRYLYEHLYLANLYFQKATGSYFNVVRSTTPPGEPVSIINSRRPFDAPLINKKTNKPFRVFYRLLKNNDTIIAKRHMPYRFDLAKLHYLNELFIELDYQVKELPNYQLKTAANPFITFKAIPAKSRYQFLLDQAQFSIMNFIKGPVCRGQVALNVIDDHFWVFFADPAYLEKFHSDGFIDDNSDLLQLPASTSDKALSLLYWHSYAKRQQEYLENKLNFISNSNFTQSDLNLDLIWSGNGNPNATLTIFRHFDSASVVQGFVGQTPKTAWFISYPLLERIHYLLVAGFDVFGNVSHQLNTRLYMDFLRMEAESNFITLLPKKERRKVHEYWYRNTNEDIKDYIFSDDFVQLPETNINYKTNQHQQELLQLVAQHTANNKVNIHQLSKQHAVHYDAHLQRLNHIEGVSVALFPQVSYLMVTGKQGDSIYTLINNSAHSNVAHLFSESKRRIPEEDTLTVVAGIIGSYPNAFFNVTQSQVDDFVNAVELLTTEQDYKTLRDNYGIRRTDKGFWPYADKLHRWYRKNQPNTSGLLDFNRLENR